MSRAESGRDGIPPDEVARLLDFYEVAGPLRDQLLSLAEDSAQRGWWDEYADVLEPSYAEFIGLEAEASHMLDWQSDAIPGLLQTPDYMKRILAGYQEAIPTAPGILERLAQVRMIRQERLTADPPIRLSAVLDEAVLRRRVGTREVMRAQLEHVLEVAGLPHVQVLVLPLDRDVSLLVTSFTILSFGSPAVGAAALGDVASAEGISVEFYVEGEPETYNYRRFFDALANGSLSPDDSLDYISHIIRTAWS